MYVISGPHVTVRGVVSYYMQHHCTPINSYANV